MPGSRGWRGVTWRTRTLCTSCFISSSTDSVLTAISLCGMWHMSIGHSSMCVGGCLIFLSGKKHEREFINGDEVGKSEVWVVKKSFFWCCFWVYCSEKPWILYVCKSISLKKTNRNFWGILKENQTVRPEKGTKKQALFQSERLLIDSDGISCKNPFSRHEMTPTFFRLMFVCVYVAKLYILKRATM